MDNRDELIEKLEKLVEALEKQLAGYASYNSNVKTLKKGK